MDVGLVTLQYAMQNRTFLYSEYLLDVKGCVVICYLAIASVGGGV